MTKIIFPFLSVPTIYTGVGTLGALRRLRPSRCVVLTSGGLCDGALTQRLRTLLKAHVIELVTKSWQGEPSIQDLAPVVQVLEGVQPDLIVAIGGGSVIDAAKAARLLYEHPDMSERFAEGRIGTIPPCGKSRLAVVPTTIGSGAEVSSSAVLFHDSGAKCFFASPELLPGMVIHDPQLLVDLPRHIRLSTMADALSHAIEGYVSRLRQPWAEMLGVVAVSVIARLAQAVVNDNISEIDLQDLQLAAMAAGYTQNHCRVGVAHALAHEAALDGVGHGAANAWYLPAAIIVNTRDAAVRQCYEALAVQAHVSGGTDGLIRLALLLREALGAHLRQPAMPDALRCAHAMQDIGGQANPCPLTESLLLETAEVASCL